MFGKAPIADLLGGGLKVTSRSSWLPAPWSPPCIPVANIRPLGTRFTSHADSKATGTEAQILKVSAFHIRPFLSWPSFTSHSFLKGLAMCSLWKAVPRLHWKLRSWTSGWIIPSGNPPRQYLQVSLERQIPQKRVLQTPLPRAGRVPGLGLSRSVPKISLTSPFL